MFSTENLERRYLRQADLTLPTSTTMWRRRAIVSQAIDEAVGNVVPDDVAGVLVEWTIGIEHFEWLIECSKEALQGWREFGTYLHELSGANAVFQPIFMLQESHERGLGRLRILMQAYFNWDLERIVYLNLPETEEEFDLQLQEGNPNVTVRKVLVAKDIARIESIQESLEDQLADLNLSVFF